MNFRKAAVLMMAMVLTFGMSAVAFANEAAGASGAGREYLVQFGAALALGIAALGGAFAQSKVAAAALEGIARNPAAQGKLFIPMVIGLALIESLVLYAFVIAFKALA